MPQLLLFMAFFLVPHTWGKTLYTMADLEVLANEGAQEEFFLHALDIRPSERLDAWKSMVSKMGDLYTKTVLSKNEVERKDFLKTEGLLGWAGLKNDDIFRLRRQEIGIKYLHGCLKQASPCWDDVKAFWEKDKRDPEVAYKLAELTLPYKDSPYSSWSFLDVALKSGLSEFYCKKPFVMNTLWGKIEVDYIKLGPKGDLMRKIDQTIHPDCMPSLLKEARARLLSPTKLFDREVAYQVLKSQSKVDQKTEDFFYVVYLLDNPSQGELFNYSWNRLKELGQSAKRRDAVLAQLRMLDPLPDSIISSLDQTKKRVILGHFKRYFPEYFNFYADQCIEYYGGKGTFPSGNPTVQCQNFMSSELAPQILDDIKILQYEEARKI